MENVAQQLFDSREDESNKEQYFTIRPVPFINAYEDNSLASPCYPTANI